MAHIYYDVKGAADRMKCSPDTIYAAAKSGDLQAKRLGKGKRAPLRFRDDWLDVWFEDVLADA